jgi:predicted phage-related endonuclease
MYLVQCHVQALVSGLDVVHVPALLGGRGRAMYRVIPNKDLMDLILERATEFWEKHVQADIPPDSPPTLEVVRYLKKTPGKRVPIEAAKVREWRELDAAAKDMTKKADAAKAVVLALLGDAVEGESELGLVKLTRSKTERIDGDALREKFPEVAKEVSKESETQRVTFKEAKGKE